MRPPAERAERERGNTLILWPVAALILVILGAITADFAKVFMAQRELTNMATAAANDAASRGLDERAFFEDEVIRLDPGTVKDAAQRRFARPPAVLEGVSFDIRVVGPDGTRVRVTAEARVDSIFAKAIPGAPDRTTVRATAEADVVEG